MRHEFKGSCSKLWLETLGTLTSQSFWSKFANVGLYELLGYFQLKSGVVCNVQQTPSTFLLSIPLIPQGSKTDKLTDDSKPIVVCLSLNYYGQLVK